MKKKKEKKKERKGLSDKKCPIRIGMGYKPQVFPGRTLPIVLLSNAHVSESDAQWY